MPVVGALEPFTGNVTTLNWINLLPPRLVERNLGYGQGRLSEGYCLLLLKEMLAPEDFEFEGTTLRSGGRVGLPGSDPSADLRRERVHDQILAARGKEGYRGLQRKVHYTITGPDRIAKILPAKRHNTLQAPDIQYPPGGGGLQWKLIGPKKFLVAMFIDESGFAHTRTTSVSLSAAQPHQTLLASKMQLMRYLRAA